MSKNPNEQRPEKTQIERFRETARALGCDEDKAAFDAALEKIATHKPDTAKPKPKKKRPDKASGRST